MSNFTSEASCRLCIPALEAFAKMSTPSGLEQTLKLSAMTHTYTVDPTPRDVWVWITTGNWPYEVSDNPPAGPTDDERSWEPCTAYSFTLEERFTLGPLHVPIYVTGRQIVMPSSRRHLYESQVKGGVVTIRKVRRFDEVDNGSGTIVSEEILGTTNFLLVSFTQRAARKAHKDQVDRYPELLHS